MKPLSFGPWPNRAKAAARLLKRQVSLVLNSTKTGSAAPSLKNVTYRQLVKAAATVRNLAVNYGGVTPLELASDADQLNSYNLRLQLTPPQLTIPKSESKLTAGQIRQLAQQAYQEARQSEDVRRLAQHVRMSSKPISVGDKIFHWQEDNSKIKFQTRNVEKG